MEYDDEDNRDYEFTDFIEESKKIIPYIARGGIIHQGSDKKRQGSGELPTQYLPKTVKIKEKLFLLLQVF